jgi:hypothetical protein
MRVRFFGGAVWHIHVAISFPKFREHLLQPLFCGLITLRADDPSDTVVPLVRRPCEIGIHQVVAF